MWGMLGPGPWCGCRVAVGFSAQICGPGAHPSLCSVLQSVLRGLGSVVSVEGGALAHRDLRREEDAPLDLCIFLTRDPHGHRGSDALVLTMLWVPILTLSQTPALPLRPV